jgi:hypothetical protein
VHTYVFLPWFPFVYLIARLVAIPRLGEAAGGAAIGVIRCARL